MLMCGYTNSHYIVLHIVIDVLLLLIIIIIIIEIYEGNCRRRGQHAARYVIYRTSGYTLLD